MLGDGFPFALQLYLLLFVSSIHETHRLQSRIRKYNFWFLSITALVLFSVAAWRFAWPKPIEPGMLHFALVALVGNGAQFFLAHGFERSQLLHLFADVCASAGVVLAALIIRQTGYVQADTWVTLAIACITAWAAWQCKKTPGGVHIHCHHHGHHH
jgi:Co/Zn/Cd efflux system component